MGGAAGALGLIRDRLSPSKGRNDYWIVVLNESGDVTSDFSLGGQNKEAAQSFSSSPCGGGIIGGISDSPVSGDVKGSVRTVGLSALITRETKFRTNVSVPLPLAARTSSASHLRTTADFCLPPGQQAKQASNRSGLPLKEVRTSGSSGLMPEETPSGHAEWGGILEN